MVLRGGGSKIPKKLAHIVSASPSREDLPVSSFPITSNERRGNPGIFLKVYFPVLDGHDVVEDGVDGGGEVVEAARDVEELLVHHLATNDGNCELKH